MIKIKTTKICFLIIRVRNHEYERLDVTGFEMIENELIEHISEDVKAIFINGKCK